MVVLTRMQAYFLFAHIITYTHPNLFSHIRVLEKKQHSLRIRLGELDQPSWLMILFAGVFGWHVSFSTDISATAFFLEIWRAVMVYPNENTDWVLTSCLLLVEARTSRTPRNQKTRGNPANRGWKEGWQSKSQCKGVGFSTLKIHHI